MCFDQENWQTDIVPHRIAFLTGKFQENDRFFGIWPKNSPKSFQIPKILSLKAFEIPESLSLASFQFSTADFSRPTSS